MFTPAGGKQKIQTRGIKVSKVRSLLWLFAAVALTLGLAAGEGVVSAEDAAAAIAAAQQGMADAQVAIDAAAAQGVDVSNAQHKLDEAGEKLAEAQAFYDQGQYADAVDKAADAGNKILDAVQALAEAAEEAEDEQEEDEVDAEDAEDEEDVEEDEDLDEDTDEDEAEVD